MKTTITTIAVFILIVLGLYLLYTSDTVKNYLNKTTDEALQPATTEIIKNLEFEPFAQYLRDDLTEKEKADLRIVLSDRENQLSRIERILSEEFEKEDANMAMAFVEVAQIREDIKSALMPYINQAKLPDFEEKYRELGQEIESRYVAK